MKFQVTIPPLTEDDFQMNVTVEGSNWRTAFRAALKKIGEGAESIKNIDCDTQDDGSFKITDQDSGRVFTVKEIAEAAAAPVPMGAAATLKEDPRQKEAERAAEQKRLEQAALAAKQREEEETRLELLRRQEDQQRAVEEAKRREETIREEERRQREQRRAAEEAKRREDEERQTIELKRRDEEERASLADKRQREERASQAEQRKKEEERAAQKRAEEQKRLDELSALAEQQRKKDEQTKKQRDEEQKRISEETRKKELAAAKISETQKLSRPKAKGETIETRLGQKAAGTDTVEFLSDAFDALVDLFSISVPQKAVEFVLDQALRKVPSEAGSVLFNDVGKRQLSFWAARGPKADKLVGKAIPYGKGIAGYCVSKSVSLAIPDVSQDPRWDPTVSEAVSFETRSILCAPLFFEGRCYGALQLLNRKSDAGFSRREASVTTYLAEQLARWLHENGE